MRWRPAAWPRGCCGWPARRTSPRSPFTYLSLDDRHLALADLLYDLPAPAPCAIADYLSSRKVPFAVAVFPVYDDACGIYSGGVPVERTLWTAREVVAALRHMTPRGDTLIMHGYTHGFTGAPNPRTTSSTAPKWTQRVRWC
ncbi:DUF2334 domain-containing protein [Dactylosporangium sp. NPDC005572]|uniref:DUF2334 domain-containing protein n=1 Tax=Dactylosporangium sp. NPDC005572 TaxID=3156889 RepID=UPI0033B753F3